MKKYKNIFLSCLVILLSLVLVGCSKTYTVNFIDYDGTILKTEEVSEAINRLGKDAAEDVINHLNANK